MFSQLLKLSGEKEANMGGSTSRTPTSLSSSMENESSAYTGLTSSNDDATGGEETEMYAQLWRACAGVLVYVPRAGETVFYFPQGHIEQVEPYINQDSEMEMPIYYLPSKILCKVVNVQLKVEIHTDEVFAQITLLPESKQDEASSNLESMLSARAPGNKPHLFSKSLTVSDTSTHGGFSLPRRLANECLPPLDMSQQPPSQEIVAKDLHGINWPFRHIYRGYPRRHLLTTGWSTFVTLKKLVVGDACIFIRGRNGDLRIGIRRSMKSQTNSSPSVISSHTVQHGILAGAFHAITSGTIFTVYYRPWTCHSCFIVPFDRYMGAMMNDYAIGKKFKMQFEDEACREQRFGGTITGIEDIDHIRWPSSKWRCIKVKWDSLPADNSLPERVSPWDVELTSPNKQKQSFAPIPPKRICLDNSSRERPLIITDGCQWAGVEASSQSKEGVFQGQEVTRVLFRDSNAAYLQIPPTKPTNRDPSVHAAANQAKPGHWIWPNRTGDGIDPGFGVDNVLAPRLSLVNLNCQERKTYEPEDEALSGRRKEIKVFGFKLVETPSELPSQQAVNRSESPTPSPSSIIPSK